MSHLAIEPEGESHTSIDFDSAIIFEESPHPQEEEEIVIDGRKSVQFSEESRESIRIKWMDKVNKEAQIVVRYAINKSYFHPLPLE